MAKKLDAILDAYGISNESLVSIKKRVFVVGRFNTSLPLGPYLFSNKKEFDQEQFKDKKDLSYQGFLDMIKPTLTESFSNEPVHGNLTLPSFEINLEKLGSNDKTEYEIEPFNYFFLRAKSSSRHEYFKGDNTVKELIDNDAGRTIFKQICSDLKNFCSFQDRNYELIDALADFIVANAISKVGLPSTFEKGVDFPIQSIPLFIEFLYKEDSKPFDSTLVEFSISESWSLAFEKNKNLPTTFSNVLTFFKRVLLSKNAEEESLIGFDTKELLKKFSKGGAKYELKEAFKKSRESYNTLTQIIKSRVLLSMVLGWAIKHIENIKSFQHIPEGVDRLVAIEEAILNGSAELKKPDDKLANGISLEQIIAEFKKYFQFILNYTYSHPDVSEAEKQEFAAMPEYIRNVALEFIENAGMNEKIKLIMQLPEQAKNNMISSLKSLIVDIVLPRIFKQPGLTLQQLEDRYKEYESTLITMISIYSMIEQNQAEVDQFFASVSKGNDLNKIVGDVIKKTIDFAVQPNVQRNFLESQTAIINIQQMRAIESRSGSDNKQLGLGGFLPLLPPKATNNEKSVTVPIQNTTANKILALASNTESLKALTAGSSDNADSNVENSETAQEQTINNQLQLYVKSDVVARQDIENKIKEIVAVGVKSYHRNMSSIFNLFGSQKKLPDFKNKVAAMTLTKLLLINSDKLHLDKAGTNLFDMLIDMVETLDGDNPDLALFFKNNSLTKYIPKQMFGNGLAKGFIALRNVIKNQTETSLSNVKQFVSELQGIKYMFDKVAEKKENEIEVVIFNGDHNDFMSYAFPNSPKVTLFHPTLLRKTSKYFPSNVFMTELSFRNGADSSNIEEKIRFIHALSVVSIRNKPICIPPITIATSASLNSDLPVEQLNWVIEGKQLGKIASNANVPVFIIGPSLPLNDPTDTFNTTLSAGYVFNVDLLVNAVAGLSMENLSEVNYGRFCSIGSGDGGLHNNINNVINYLGKTKTYCFSSDYYLYLINLIGLCINNSSDKDFMNIGEDAFWEAYFNCFFSGEPNDKYFKSINILDEAMLRGKMTEWSFNAPLTSRNPRVEYIIKNFKDGTKVPNNKKPQCAHVEWFNKIWEYEPEPAPNQDN